MNRKKVYKTWRSPDAGRCRNCGTLYIPDCGKKGECKKGCVLELDFCQGCALRCPNCLEWLSRVEVEVEVQGRWTWYLAKNDETGKFYASDHKGLDENLLYAQCPRCKFEINPDLLEI